MADLRVPEQNKVFLIGRLTRDPELRFTPKGQQVCVFDLAVNRRYRDATGNWLDDTTFAPVETWGQLAERCAKKLAKGAPATVEGRLQSESWQGKDGQKRTRLVIVAQRVQSMLRSEGQPEGQSEGHAEEGDDVEGADLSAPSPEPVPAAKIKDDVPF